MSRVRDIVRKSGPDATGPRCQGGKIVWWSSAAASVWGKLDPADASWLPLTVHLEHAAAMAGHLWDGFLPRSLRALIASDLDVDEAGARALCRWYAGVHDVGKASVAFAQQADRQGMQFVLDRMRDQGLSTIPIPRPDNVRHEVVSQQAVRDWLEDAFGARRRVANTWACVVGGHHGKNPTEVKLAEAETRPHVVGTGPWGEVRREILDAMAD